MMPLMKIPDSVISKIRCHCGKFVTNSPAPGNSQDLGQDGQVVCGNCANLQTTEPLVPPGTPFEALVKLFTYPCRYKTHGCQQYMKFEDIKNHECICSYCTIDCPVNSHAFCVWKGALCQLYDHCQSKHPKLCVQSPSFSIRIDESYTVYRMFKDDNTVLLLQVKCVVGEDMVWFNTVCFGSADDVKLITYTVKLSSAARSLILEEAHPMPITSFQLAPEESIKVNISSIFSILQDPVINCNWLFTKAPHQQKIKTEQQMKTIKCPNCNICMVPPIYRCDQNHLTCGDCKGYHNACKICQKYKVIFTEATELLEVVKSEQYYCRWASCTKPFPCTEIRQHEQGCSRRIYQCPVCLGWSGLGREIMDHFKNVHPGTKFYSTNLSSTSIEISRYQETTGYIFTLGELFKFNFKKPAYQDSYLLKIYYLGAPGMINFWKYQIKGWFAKQPISLTILDKKEVEDNVYSATVPYNILSWTSNSKEICNLCITKTSI